MNNFSYSRAPVVEAVWQQLGPGPGLHHRHRLRQVHRRRHQPDRALVAVAAALDLAEDGTIREARVAMGEVARKAWRREEAERLLAGRRAERAAFDLAAEVLLAGAQAHGRGLGTSVFKIPLARR